MRQAGSSVQKKAEIPMNGYTIPERLPEAYISCEFDKLSFESALETARETRGPAVSRVIGDCLAGAGVLSGDFVGIDFNRKPRPPLFKKKHGVDRVDICLCYALFPGTKAPTVLLKQYHGVWGSWQMVGTRPAKGLGACFDAMEIYGVVFACWDSAGVLKWEQDISDCPVELSTIPTVGGGDVSDPLPITAGLQKAVTV